MDNRILPAIFSNYLYIALAHPKLVLLRYNRAVLRCSLVDLT